MVGGHHGVRNRVEGVMALGRLRATVADPRRQPLSLPR